MGKNVIFHLKQYNFVWRQIYTLMNLNLVQMKILKQRALDSKKYQYFQKPVAELSGMLLITFKSSEYIPQQSQLSEQLGYQSHFLQTSSQDFQLLKKDISCQNYKINSFSSFYKSEQQEQEEIDSNIHIRKIIRMIRQTKNLYLFKREFPQGYEISVTFIELLSLWAVMYGEQCIFIKNTDLKENKSSDRSIVQQICYFWKKYCQQIKIQQVKEYLKSHIIRGILAYDFSSIKWFQSNINTLCGYKLADDQLSKLKQLNMDITSQSRSQLIVNEDHLHRVVQDFALSILASASKENQQFIGRSKMYFTSSKLQVWVILNINPFHLYLTEEIRRLVSQDINIQKGVQHLKETYQQLKRELNYSIPYPFLYYQKIYLSINQFINSISLTITARSSKFEQILKVVLYMEFKQISIKKYGEIFYLNQNLTKNMLKIDIQNYGPVGCKVVTFFSFISCRGSMDPLKETIRRIFTEANLHIDQLESTNHYSQVISNQSNKDSSVQLCNFFLNTNPNSNQWRLFCCEHQKRQNNDTFYRLIYICQNNSSFFKFGEGFYPFSIQTISNAYYKAYILRKSQRFLKGRAQELKYVTCFLNQMKNTNLAHQAKTIQIQFHQQAVNPELAKRISTILKSEINEENVNHYYLLLSGLEKYKLQEKSQISESSLACLLSQIFFNVPTIKPQGWL